MPKFPTDLPEKRVIKALELLGFELLRNPNHTIMRRINPDRSTDKITIATGHKTIKGSTLLGSLGKANVTRDDFLSAYEKA
jgi:predicted RNA binding protein YcfA (HicA-like mRNA interferase family)